jgi:hypothetical protein
MDPAQGNLVPLLIVAAVTGPGIITPEREIRIASDKKMKSGMHTILLDDIGLENASKNLKSVKNIRNNLSVTSNLLKAPQFLFPFVIHQTEDPKHLDK